MNSLLETTPCLPAFPLSRGDLHHAMGLTPIRGVAVSNGSTSLRRHEVCCPGGLIAVSLSDEQVVRRVGEHCAAWADQLEQADAEALLAAIRVLRDQGPALGRPLVDTVKASRHKNMKELRPGSTGRTEVRVLFAFDLDRQAILLLGGDKSDDWGGWYEQNIPIADQRFDQHQAELTAGRTKKPRQTKRKRR